MSDGPRITPMRCTSASSKQDINDPRMYWVYTFDPDIKQADLHLDQERQKLEDETDDTWLKPTMGALTKTRIISDGPMPDFVPGKLYALSFHEIEEIPEPGIPLGDALSRLFGGQVFILGRDRPQGDR